MADILRLSGIVVAEDRLHLDLLVPEQYARTFFKNVAENRKISVLCASVFSYEAYQVKGIYLGFRPSTPEEAEYQKNYFYGFSRSMLDIGVKSGLFFADYYQEPSLAIRMKSEEVYDQTPKVGTGNKIS
ncbi:hypothetical protein [Cesiribacter sp. SM1]|uniref:hypothetical protein n=1 Tax=Cesiribacter sp. SM1 TaxID=2861196 RepID=UPI001CD270B9|nr:hypothetical protein [Cesiribacter sp. SM1]